MVKTDFFLASAKYSRETNMSEIKVPVINVGIVCVELLLQVVSTF